MDYEVDDQEVVETSINWTDLSPSDISTVFMTLARRALAAREKAGIPLRDDLRRLARWCELHRHVLFDLSKIQVDPESRQRAVWLHELASVPTGGWDDLRARLASFIRLFGSPPRSKFAPFLSAEGSFQGERET
jgi:hypothetical protein